MRTSSLIALSTGGATGIAIAGIASTVHGYVVPFVFLWAVGITLLLLLVSAALAFFARLRWLSISLALSALSVTATCWLALLALNWAGTWDHEMVSFGPEVPADRVVAFVEDPSEADINRFIEEVLSTPHPVRGYSFRPPLLSLLRVQVDGRIGLALQFHAQANESHIARLDDDIEGHPIVFRLFRDTVPLESVLHSDRRDVPPNHSLQRTRP